MIRVSVVERHRICGKESIVRFFRCDDSVVRHGNAAPLLRQQRRHRERRQSTIFTLLLEEKIFVSGWFRNVHKIAIGVKPFSLITPKLENGNDASSTATPTNLQVATV